MQALRRRRAPVAGHALARELGVSLRTLYRDVETLRAQGAAIEGGAGLGYVLRPGFTLPPLMFARAEIDALALGLRFVAKQDDDALAAAATDALAKIVAVLPPDLADSLDAAPLVAGPSRRRLAHAVPLSALREAIALERKLELEYRDLAERRTRRIVWPVAIAFFDEARVLAAWCELRGAFRHFRLDRILAVAMRDERPPRRRAALMREWRATLKASERARSAADGN